MFRRLIRERHKTGNMILFTSGASLIGNVLTMISGLLVARWMLPEELGYFNSFSILTSYIILVQLGIPSGLSRELPFYMGKGQRKDVEELAATAQFFGSFIGVLVFICSVIAALFFFVQGNLKLTAGAFVIGITAFQALFVTKYLKVLFRSNADFNKLAFIDVVVAVTSFISIWFVWKYGFYGLCIRAIIVALVDSTLTFFWRPIRVYPKWSTKRFIELFKIGMPIYSVASVYGLWPVFQRTVILFLGGTKALGLFTLAIIIDGTLKTVSNSISSITFPKMSYAYGQGAGFKELMNIPLKFVGINLGLNTLVLAVGWFLLPIAVAYILPNYVDGVEAAQWMFIVSLLGILSIFSNVYMVIKRNFDRLKAYIVGIVVWALVVLYYHLTIPFDLVIFPKALIAGYIATFIVDAFFYYKYYQMDSLSAKVDQ